MIRVTGIKYQGLTLADMLKTLIADPQHTHLATKTLLIVLNGELVAPVNYEKISIQQEDVITVMPFMAGG